MHIIEKSDDALFAHALRLARLKQDSSISFLQRHFSLPYTAARALQASLREAGAYDGIEMIEEPAAWAIRIVAISAARALVGAWIGDDQAGAVKPIDAFPLDASDDEVNPQFRRHVQAANLLIVTGDGRCARSLELMALLAELANAEGTRCWMLQSPADQAGSALRHPCCELVFDLPPDERGSAPALASPPCSSAGLLAGLLARGSGVIRPSLHAILMTLRGAGRVSIARGAGEGDGRLTLALRQACAALPTISATPTGVLVVVSHGHASRLIRGDDVRRALTPWLGSGTRMEIAYFLDGTPGGDRIEVTLLVQSALGEADSMDKAGA
jgi:hypothetical protein